MADAQPDPRLAESGLDKVELFARLQKKSSVEALLAGKQALWLDRGSVVVSQGEYSGQLFVVLEGLLAAWRTESSGEIVRLDTIQPGQWFGESSALSNQPAMATIEAQTECTLVRIEAAVFKKLYAEEKRFQDEIDKRYRERSLAAHLRVIPLFRRLPEKTLRALQQQVEFLVFKDKSVIAKEGEAADGVYLVRSGAVKCTTRGPRGEEKVLSYSMDNSSFGERSLAGGEQRWPGTYETMARTDVVKIPRAVIEEVCDAAGRSTLQQTASLLVAQEVSGSPGLFDLLSKAPAGGQLTSDQLETMVAGQSVKGGHALVIDLTKCVRCNACVESCVAVHADRVPRLSKTGNRLSSQVTLASACYHCAIPECMLACSFGAIRRDLRGSIEFIYDNCVGCTACVGKCPYNVIRMTPPPTESTSQESSVLAELPLIGAWFRPREAAKNKPVLAREPGAPLKQVNRITGREEEVAGKAIKCDLCAGLPFEACVYNCPCGAILRVEPESLFGREA